MKFTVFDATSFEAEPDKWKLSRCTDFTRPSELELTFPRSVPVNDRAKIEAEEGGKIWFRGYVYSQKIKNKNQKTVKCYGVEDLLFRRYCPRYGLTRSFANYGSSWADTWKPIYKLLESENPSIDGFGPRLGLLYLANSALPEALIEHYDDDNWTFVIYGYGTDFSEEEDITFFGKALTKQTTLAACQSTSNSYYRDADNLYIHPNATNFPDATHGIVCIENAFDTTIRLGEYSEDLNRESIQMPSFQVDGETYGDLIQAIADWHGLDIAIRYEKDGYTYLDMVDEPGRWIDGSVEIREEDLADISSKSPSELIPQALLGLGYGGQEGRQKYTVSDPTAKGFWLHGTYENENAFNDSDSILPTLTNAEWDRLQSQENIYELELIKPIEVNPYDYIKLRLDYEVPLVLPVEQIDYENGVMSLSLGNRDSDILDEFNGRGGEQCYAKDILRDGDPIWSTSGDVDVTPGSFLGSDGSISSWGTPGSVSIECSDSYISGATKVILEISTDEDYYPNWNTLVKITIGGETNDNTILRFYKTLDSSGGIDITDICPPGSTKTFNFYLVYTAPQILTPNPVTLSYTVKYIYTDDVSAYTTPDGTILLFDGEVGAAGNPAYAYLNFDGIWGNPDPVDATGLTKANGTLVIDLKCDEPSLLTSNGQIELTSSGGPDSEEWHVAVPRSSITTSWTTFEIALSSAVTTGGELDVTAIDYLRWYNYSSSGNVHIYWRRAYLKMAS